MKVIINDFILDLTSKGVTSVEKNNVFRDNITKSFSLPFNLILTKEISQAFGIVQINDVVNYPTKIPVVIFKSLQYFNGYIKISKIIKDTATLTLFYGRETLAVYDKKLNQLSFEQVDVIDVKTFAKKQNTKQWPQVTHNFVTVRDENFKENSNYENFEGYINNTNNGNFIGNSYQTIEEQQVLFNRNVMVPMPYIMEILKVGYLEENKVILGDFVDDVFNHKILHVPENHLERLSSITYNNTNFNQPTSSFVSGNNVFSSYALQYETHSLGTYILNVKFEMPEHIAAYFDLKITQNETVIYSLKSENKAISINEKIIVNVDAANTTEFINISLTLKEQIPSISRYNSIVFQLQDDKLNVFNNKYDLADFMPDMTFREYVNEIENLFNLDVDVQDNVVYLNYLDKSIKKIIFEDKKVYQIESPVRKIDNSKTFSLKLANGSEIFVDKNGILPVTSSDGLESHTSIDIDVIPLEVQNIDGIKTANQVKETAGLKLVLYNGLVDNLPLAASSFNNRKLDIRSFYDNWQNWLKFRTSSEVIEDTFFAHVTENFDVRKGLLKYNKKHIIKEVKTVTVNSKFNKVSVISETF